jgi:hypothetical protein
MHISMNVKLMYIFRLQCNTHKSRHQLVAKLFYNYYTKLPHVSALYPGDPQGLREQRIWQLTSFNSSMFQSKLYHSQAGLIFTKKVNNAIYNTLLCLYFVRSHKLE